MLLCECFCVHASVCVPLCAYVRVCPYPSYLADVVVEVVLLLHGRRRGVIAPPPDLNLGLAVLLRCLCLVEPRQASVVALVEAPGAVDRKPHLVDPVQDQPQSPDGSLQD